MWAAKEHFMDKDQIFSIIKQNIVDVVPDLANRTIAIEDSLKDLGANSVDRAEIIIKSMAALQLKVPLVEFGQAKNIQELVNIFASKLTSKVS